MTLPSISPVILFAVVLGVIQALQYFTQAYVAASVAGGPGVTGGLDEHARARLPGGLDALLPVLLYYHGFRYFNMGYASALAILLLAVSFLVTLRDRPQLAPLGALRRGDPLMATRRARAAPFVRRQLPARGAPAPASSIAVADHSLLIAAAIVFLAPVVFIVLTALMTDNQALRRSSGRSPFHWCNYIDVFQQAPLWRWTLNTFDLRGLATLGVLVSCIPVAYALAQAALARAATPSFLVVLVALMLPPQVTVVPLYVMWAKLGTSSASIAAGR